MSGHEAQEPRDASPSSGEKADAAPAPPPQNAGPSPPPNGGLAAWLQVLGGFMLFFNTWGILKYASHHRQPSIPHAETKLTIPPQHLRRLPNLLRKRPALD